MSSLPLTQVQEDLFESNKKLAYYMTQKLLPRTLNENNKDDFCQTAMLGLLKAVKTYQAERKVKFSTYAAVCIQNEIIQMLRDNRKLQRTISFTDLAEKLVLESKELDDVAELGDKIIRDNLELIAIREDVNLVKQKVRRLPFTKRQIFFYFAVYNMKQEEIAKKIGISQSYVSKVMKQIRKSVQPAIFN